MVGVGAVALVVRVAYVLVAGRYRALGTSPWHPGDAFFYHTGANLLADGKGFIQPYFLPGRYQAADHPPLYLLYLAVPSLLGMRSVLSHMLWSCLLGTGTVVVVGFTAREVRDSRTGVIAAVIAALYANLWAPDGALMSESLSMFLVAVALVLAYRYWEAPSWQRMSGLGMVCGLAALSRAELVLLMPLLVVPLGLLAKSHSVAHRIVACGVGVAVGVAVIAPWTIYNATRFKHPIVLSSQFGVTLAGANCRSTYYGRDFGYWDINCAREAQIRARLPWAADESEIDTVLRNAGLKYIGSHLDRLPTVEKERLSRVLGVMKPSSYVATDTVIDSREAWVAWLGLISFYAVALLAIGGIVVVRKSRSVPVFPLLVPIAIFFITTLILYGETRFRTTAEPSLVVLAAVAIDAVIVRFSRRNAALSLLPDESQQESEPLSEARR
jgi:4-amino-4-deoxy-L-arabinose transferase-like glycosyltransferase